MPTAARKKKRSKKVSFQRPPRWIHESVAAQLRPRRPGAPASRTR